MADLFTQEIKDFIAENYKKMMKPEILKIIHEKYGCTKMTYCQLKNYYSKNNLRSGIDCRGRTAGWNKGKKMPEHVYEKAKPTMFKKGSVPHNHRPVGSERITVDGYIEIKVEEPKKWKLKHRLVYEQYHNVTVGRNYAITFLDGNPLNCDIDNLVLVSRSALKIINQRFADLNNCHDPEIKKAIISLANNIDATHKAKKRKGGANN